MNLCIFVYMYFYFLVSNSQLTSRICVFSPHSIYPLVNNINTWLFTMDGYQILDVGGKQQGNLSSRKLIPDKNDGYVGFEIMSVEECSVNFQDFIGIFLLIKCRILPFFPDSYLYFLHCFTTIPL